MKKLFFFFLLFGFTYFNCLAQETNGDVTDVTKITILNPGFSYEKRIGKFQTLFLQAFMNLSSVTRDAGYGAKSVTFYFDPAITGQYRYYYNFNKRSENGLRTSLNNLNYICAAWQTFFSKLPLNGKSYEAENSRAVNLVAIAWGIQRNYKKRFALDLNVGPGMLFAPNSILNDEGNKVTVNQSQFTLYGQLNIGFWLNSRDKNPE